MRKFTRKGYGAIVVDKQENIDIVKNEIKIMDEYEYAYMPEDLIMTLDYFLKEIAKPGYFELPYTHKFDSIDIDLLTIRLLKKGVYIFCICNAYNEYLVLEESLK